MTETIRAACVMGWPVKQSRSPLIHGYWLKQHGLEGDYRREAVRPEDFRRFPRRISPSAAMSAATSPCRTRTWL